MRKWRIILREAIELPELSGERPVAASALPGLNDVGRPVREAAVARGAREVEPSPALSEAERRVAALAASGDTNREISSKLYITVSTVEQHLTRVYRKLNVSRTGLAGKLGQAGMPSGEGWDSLPGPDGRPEEQAG